MGSLGCTQPLPAASIHSMTRTTELGSIVVAPVAAATSKGTPITRRSMCASIHWWTSGGSVGSRADLQQAQISWGATSP